MPSPFKHSRPIVWSIFLLLWTTGCASDPPAGVGDASTTEGDSRSVDSAPADTAPGNDAAPTSDVPTDAGGPGVDGDALPVDTDASDVSDTDASSLCQSTDDTISCPFQTETISTGLTGLTRRDVHWQTPAGTPPADGWPTVLLFQGAFASAQYDWEADRDDAYGGFWRVRTIEALLDAGFAILAPEAIADGSTYWQTNVPPFATAWETSADHQFMLDIFSTIEEGRFGDLDADSLYATGFSSGGYMTSRMADAYTDRFDALVIHAGSWAWCSSSACVVPSEMPSGHPPTLFLHGGQDKVVPAATMHDYHDALEDAGVPTRSIVNSSVGHAWLPASPDAVSRWFAEH